MGVRVATKLGRGLSPRIPRYMIKGTLPYSRPMRATLAALRDRVQRVIGGDAANGVHSTLPSTCILHLLPPRFPIGVHGG